MAVKYSLVLLGIIFSCSTNQNKTSSQNSCGAGRTIVNGICVSQVVADYVSCVRARGSEIENNQKNSLNFEVTYLASARTSFEASERLLEKYPDTNKNIRAIIDECGKISSANVSNDNLTKKQSKLSSKISKRTPMSTFDNRNENGWTMVNGKMKNPGAGGNGGGSRNGALVVTKDFAGKIGYFVSPPMYRGNWELFSNLKFDMWSKGGRYFTTIKDVDYPDIVIFSGYSKAQRFLSQRPSTIWESFTVPLKDDGGWVFEGGISNLKNILSNVTGFHIRAEYGNGVDISALDNVELR